MERIHTTIYMISETVVYKVQHRIAEPEPNGPLGKETKCYHTILSYVGCIIFICSYKKKGKKSHIVIMKFYTKTVNKVQYWIYENAFKF